MQQRCWACGCLNVLPLGESGRPLPLFKCGWCAALNSPVEGDRAPATVDPAAPRLLLQKTERCRRLPGPTAAGYTLITIVMLIVGSLFVLALSLVMPALFSLLAMATLHLPMAGLLVANILFNYAACILRHPGPVKVALHRATLNGGGRVLRQALDGCRYCEHCCYYKPPQAHHCRSCGCCVMEMDHHCLYINNCAGAANLRHFLLFLAYIVVGTGYGLALGLLMGWRDRQTLWSHTLNVLQGTSHMHPLLRMLSFNINWLLAAPHWVACWAYYTFACWVTLLSVGLLFARQVRQLLRGQSYLDTLPYQRYQQGQNASAPVAALASETASLPQPPMQAAEPNAAMVPVVSPAMWHLRRVFGSVHPLAWLLPAWDVPSQAD